jgi:hypothetical protein
MAVFDAVDDAGRISRTLKEFINSRSIPMWAETLNDAKSDDRKTGRSKNGQTLQYRYALHRSDSSGGPVMSGLRDSNWGDSARSE